MITRPLKPGDRVRVKAVPLLRKYGLDVHNWTSPADRKAWPMEIGVVEERRWRSGPGQPEQKALFIVFSRERRISLAYDGVLAGSARFDLALVKPGAKT